MVDDSTSPRHFDRAIAPTRPTSNTRIVSLHHTRPAEVRYRRGKGICSPVLMGLGWIEANTRSPFVLKLDTDSLVIGRFVDRLAARFAGDASLGVVGAYRHTPTGAERDVSDHAKNLDRFDRERFDLRRPISSWRDARREPGATVRRLLDRAKVHGYRMAEHCLGGGYAVSRGLLDRMRRSGDFANTSRWLDIDLPEDVTVGLHCRACGLTMDDEVSEGRVFGVAYRGLPFAPDELLRRGHAVIHAVKNDPAISESDVRAFYRARR